MMAPVEIANKCPRCTAPVIAGPMQTGLSVSPETVGLGYQCSNVEFCDWFVIQPPNNTMTVDEFLAVAVPR